MQLSKIISICLLSLIVLTTQAQHTFNHDDTLRGTISPIRDWFDITKYDITVQPDFNSKTIQGHTEWTFKVVKQAQQMQIDLQQPLIIDSIIFQNKSLAFERYHNVAFVTNTNTLPINSIQKIHIYYHGQPREAINPPWDGGWIWKKDANGKSWASVACQALGASVWYPCKDHQSDEPDQGASLTMIVPNELDAIGNGRLNSTTVLQNGLKKVTWAITNPINNYNIIPYIGDYIHWTDQYKGLKGNLDLQYYALREDSSKARNQYQQVPKMLEAFEYWFGPYPFYEDSYKIIQSPHLGMEHQSAIGYGNKWKNGYLGRDLSGSGWGLKWDFIIVHESGHEWFANNITSNDLADMWVHEGFTNYSETLFTEYFYGKDAGNEYNVGSRRGIRNDKPIIAHYGVNEEGSGDMYPKSGSMIQSIRHSIDNDTLFRKILIGLNKTFYHKTVTTKEIEDYISVQSGINFSKIFDQYLRTIQIPTLVLTYDKKEKILTYQWKNCVEGFDFGLRFDYQKQKQVLLPVDYMSQKRLIKTENFDIDSFADTIKKNYYVNCTTLVN
jgi:aminopeptidase N